MKRIIGGIALTFVLALAAPSSAASTLAASACPFVPSSAVTVDADGQIPLMPGIHAVDVRIHVGKDVVRGRFVEPDTGTRHPGVLFVHWLGDPKTTNMTEFAAEAITLGGKGVTSLMIDAFWAKPDWFEKGRSPQTDYDDSLRQVAQLRGALDALVARANVDPAKMAFVGHDFGAMYGAVLAGFDHRPRYYVFIAGVPTFSEWYLLGAKPADDAPLSARVSTRVDGKRLPLSVRPQRPLRSDSEGARVFRRVAGAEDARLLRRRPRPAFAARDRRPGALAARASYAPARMTPCYS